MFMELFSPSYQYDICHNRDKCISGEYPTLARIERIYGSKASAKWMVPQLHDLSEFCGARVKLCGKSLEDTAMLISSEYRHLKVSEVMLFFYLFKMGTFGRFYGNIDPMVIMSSLREFVVIRNDAIYRMDMERSRENARLSEERAVTYEEYMRMKLSGELGCAAGTDNHTTDMNHGKMQ